MGDFYIVNEYWFAVFQLVLAMLGMGATLTLKDFKSVLLTPYAVTIGTLIQLIVIPLSAFAFVSLLDLPTGVAVGIALIVAVPGGTSSNIFTHFASGSVPLSISITAITTLACLATTPFVLDFLIAAHMPPDFVMPTEQIMKEISLNLLLPLAIGMVILYLRPKFAEPLSKWSIRGSVLGLFMIFAGSAVAGRLDVEKFGLSNIMMIGLFILIIMLLGWLVPRLLGLSHADSTAVEMEVVVRNINLGLMLKASIFPTVIGQENTLGDMVLFSLLLYGAIQLMLGIGLIMLRRPKSASAAVAQDGPIH